MSPMRWVRKAVFGMRQEDFAELAGVSRPSVSRYETETDNPPFPVLKRLRDEGRKRDPAFSGDWFFEIPPGRAADAVEPTVAVRAREDVQ